MTASWPRRLAWISALAALTAANAYLKLRHSTSLPRFDPGDETGYYSVESALQYRYARLAARGSAIPEVDRAAQHPEGLRTSRELAMAMPKLTGWTYRLFPAGTFPDFRRFALAWTAAVSSLSVAALALLCLAVTRDPQLSLAAAAVFAFSWAGMADQIGTYGLHSLALPLLYLALALAARSLSAEAGGALLGAAAAAALAMASWHLSRFLLIGFWLAALATWLSLPPADPARPRLARATGAILAACALAGLASPLLRETRFALSPAMALGVAVLGAMTLRPMAAAGLAAALAAAGLALARGAEAGAYGHVYALLSAKLAHALAKPADPALLSVETRLLWTGPFNSPEAGFLVFSLLPFGLVLLPRAAFALRRPAPAGAAAAGRLVDALALLAAASAALVSRMTAMAAFLLCAACVRGLPARGAPGRAWALAWLVAIAALEGLKASAPASPLNAVMRLAASLTDVESAPTASWRNERAALRWLERHGEGRPVLAGFGFSAPILAYTGNPVLLHPKFESAAARAKAAGFLAALYGSEEELWRYCLRHEAGLLVYTTDMILDAGRDGPRYMAGGPPLRKDSAAVGLHFYPERLARFRLAYQNPDIRIFEVGAPGNSAAETPPVYDIARYGASEGTDGALSLDIAGVLRRIRESRSALTMARVLGMMGRPREASEAYTRAFETWPDPEIQRERRRLLP